MKKYLLLTAAIISFYSFISYINKKPAASLKPVSSNIIVMKNNSLNTYKIVQPHKQNKLNKEIKDTEKQLVQVAKPAPKKIDITAAAKQTSKSPAVQPASKAPAAPPVVLVPVSKLKAGANSEQLIVITNKTITSCKAVCNVYEKVNGQWKYVWKDLYAVTGIKGMSYNRHEGDMTSPAGIFTLTQAFGIAANPGTKMPYRIVQGDDWWAGDSLNPATYNTWQKAPSTGWRESESEHLIDIPVYKYAMIIDFNTERIPYKGSAIFFHIAPYTGGGTAGCIGLKESDLVGILKWINPAMNPKIIICPEADLSKF